MKKTVASLLAVSLALASGSAFAASNFYHEKSKIRIRDFGNSNLGGDYTYGTLSSQQQGTYSNGDPYELVEARGQLEAYAWVYKQHIQVVNVLAGGSGYRWVEGKKSHVTPYAQGVVYVLGNKLFEKPKDNYSCGSNANKSCVSYKKSYSKTLAKVEKTFYAGGFIPVEVGAKLSGSLSTGVSGEGYAKEPGSGFDFVGKGSASVSADARLYTTLHATAGWDDVAAVGVNATVTLLEVGVTPTVSSQQQLAWGTTTVWWHGQMPFEVSSLDGKVVVWADFFGAHYTDTIVKWDGESWDTNLLDESGSAIYR